MAKAGSTKPVSGEKSDEQAYRSWFEAQRKASAAADEAGGAFLQVELGKPKPDVSRAELNFGNARALLQILAVAIAENKIDISESDLGEGLWGIRSLIGQGMELLGREAER